MYMYVIYIVIYIIYIECDTSITIERYESMLLHNLVINLVL